MDGMILSLYVVAAIMGGLAGAGFALTCAPRDARSGRVPAYVLIFSAAFCSYLFVFIAFDVFGV